MGRYRGWVLILLGAGLAAGGGLWKSAVADRDARFLRERLAVAEGENARLRKLVGESEARRTMEEDLPRRAEIETITAGVRELKFLSPVTYEILDRARVPEVVREKLAQHYQPEDFRRMSAAYAALGLLPEGYDLEKGIIGLLGEQMAAFYDQHADRLFLLGGTRLDRSNDRMILSHELTHALQDQHFKLETFPLQDKENDDLVMALGALIEGDATVVMSRFLLEDSAPPRAGELVSALLSQDLAQLAAAPRFLRESLLFPYVQGQKFCDTLVAHGGMEGVTRAFRDPPRSSAEILDPSRYLAPALRPRRVFAPELKAPAGVELVATNVAGRFGIECMFDEWLAGKDGDAAGWDADRYWVYKVSAGGQLIAWRSRWRTPEAAAQFEASLLQIREAMDARRGGRPPGVGRTLERRENEVLLVEGIEALLPALGAALDSVAVSAIPPAAP